MRVFTPALEAQVVRLTEKHVTQFAALCFGVFVGLVFWLVLQSNPPTLIALSAVVAPLIGVILTGALDVLTPARGRRLHAAYYIIGLLVGVLLMMFLIWSGVQTPLAPPATPTPTPTSTATPTPS